MSHRQTFPVTMDSVDAVGIVYFGAYWNWFEQVFEGLVRVGSGMSWREVLEAGNALPVVHAEIDYLHPLRLSDTVTVEIGVVRLGRRSVHFEARFWNGEGDVVAVARTVNVATTRGDLAARDLPAWLEITMDGSENSHPHDPRRRPEHEKGTRDQQT